MIPKVWREIGMWSLLACAGVVFFGFPFAFNPGWANGWPFDLTIHTVWSAGMTALFFLLVLFATVALGAAAGMASSRFGFGQSCGRVAFASWVVCCAVLAAMASIWAFEVIYASTLELWPNGYPVSAR